VSDTETELRVLRVEYEALRQANEPLTNALEQAQAYEPYPEDQALMGPDRPSMGTILDLIRYCTTIHSRFGNTCIESLRFQWGGSALNARSSKGKRIKQLEAALKVYEDIVADSNGVDGYHLNGDIALWDEFELPAITKDTTP